MQINDIYKYYQIMPNLQMHMLRAAAVGTVIADYWKSDIKIDKEAITIMLLLHDMGNIIKFDLDRFPKLLQEEYGRLNYWKNVQQFYLSKYGRSEHEATFLIAKEIGIPHNMQNFLEKMCSLPLKAIREMNDFTIKIGIYSDLRVAPFGIVSVNRRFDDLIERYKGRNHAISNTKETELNRMHTLEIEKQIQAKIELPLSGITDAMVIPYINRLLTFVIPSE
jgi:hypothetical protein